MLLLCVRGSFKIMKKNTILIILSSVAASAVLALFLIYFAIIPFVVSNNKIMNSICKIINKNLPVELKIENPNLKTKINSDIIFKAKKIALVDKGVNLFEIDNLNVDVSLRGLFQKKLTVNHLGADYIFADANKLINAFPQDENAKNQETDFNINLYDSILDLKKSLFLYSPKKDCNIKVTADNINIDNTNKKERFVHFDIGTEIQNQNKTLSFKIAY